MTAANRQSLLNMLHPNLRIISDAPVFTQLSCGIAFCYGTPIQIDTRFAVLIASESAELPTSFTAERCVAIIDSDNSELCAEISRRKIPALTCGRHSADSFTFSSWQADRAVISLQRQLKSFDGSIVEPFDLPVAYDIAPEPFDLLACAAVYCLLGQQSPLNKQEVWHLTAPYLL